MSSVRFAETATFEMRWRFRVAMDQQPAHGFATREEAGKRLLKP